MIYIRTDANEVIATGHIMRCITISEQLKKLGENVIFIIRDVYSKEFLPKSSVFVQIESDTDMYGEICEIKDVMRTYGIGKLLLDSYLFHADYMSMVREFAEKIITFDDMYMEAFPVDLLINYNLYYELFDYEERYRESVTKLLLGGNYVPLREQFQNLKLVKPRPVKRIMLICGGGNGLGFLGCIVKRICETGFYKKYRFIVVCGAINEEYDMLCSYGVKYPEIEVTRNICNMANVLQSVDIVVSAASTVLYECCCVGVPTIFFMVADNQKYTLDAFTQKDMMLYAGDFRYQREAVVENIFSFIERIAGDEECRKRMVQDMRKKVDGKGAERIAKEIADL